MRSYPSEHEEQAALFRWAALQQRRRPELALQAHQQVELVVPERLIPHRFLGGARREGVHWHWIQRSVRRQRLGSYPQDYPQIEVAIRGIRETSCIKIGPQKAGLQGSYGSWGKETEGNLVEAAGIEPASAGAPPSVLHA